AVVRVSENVAGGGHEKDGDHDAHAGGEQGVHASGSFDALNIHERKYGSEEDGPDRVRNSGCEDVGLLAAPDDADHGIEHVVHDHAPAGNVAERRIDFLAD